MVSMHATVKVEIIAYISFLTYVYEHQKLFQKPSFQLPIVVEFPVYDLPYSTSIVYNYLMLQLTMQIKYVRYVCVSQTSVQKFASLWEQADPFFSFIDLMNGKSHDNSKRTGDTVYSIVARLVMHQRPTDTEQMIDCSQKDWNNKTMHT